MISLRSVAVGLVFSALAGVAQPQVGDKKTLTLDGAKKVVAAAAAYAKQNNAPGGVIAVVDDGGNLMALERLDGTFAAGANISIGKARTAVLFKRPTKVFEDIINKGRTAMAALPDTFFTPLQGGIPIIVDGQIIGAVGVSGAASAQQDEELAIAGATAMATSSAQAQSFFRSRSEKGPSDENRQEFNCNLVSSITEGWSSGPTPRQENSNSGSGGAGRRRCSGGSEEKKRHRRHRCGGRWRISPRS